MSIYKLYLQLFEERPNGARDNARSELRELVIGKTAAEGEYRCGT